MQDLTVSCGCGRKMLTDSIRGRGAFKCGCGIRIQVCEPESPKGQCVAPENDGASCRRRVTVSDPFPLCYEHFVSSGLKQYKAWCDLGPEGRFDALQELAWLRLTLELDAQAKKSGAATQLAASPAENRQALLRDVQDAARSREGRGLIYFIRIGDLVKIGKTLDLKKRVTGFSYPGIEVLATEPGYTERETLLHRRFKRYRHSGEWFRYGSELRQYVEGLQSRPLHKATPTRDRAVR